MTHLIKFLSTSSHPMAKGARATYQAFANFSIPAPRVATLPLLWIFVAVRAVYYFVARVFVCEPLLKARCRKYGKGLRTGVYIHWIDGPGEIVLGDHVTLDGKCDILFGRGGEDTPTLTIGDHSFVGHHSTLAAAKSITIGKHCLIANNVWITDSPGHPVAARKRREGLPPEPGQVRPVTIGDNVWIGRGAVILPGVTIGDNSIVATHAIVMKSVPPNKVVMGNPARVVSFVPSG